MFAEDAYPSIETLEQFEANPSRQIACARKLGTLGFTIEKLGRFSISASVWASRFAEFFERVQFSHGDQATFLFLGLSAATSSASGCCASCGCSVPA